MIYIPNRRNSLFRNLRTGKSYGFDQVINTRLRNETFSPSLVKGLLMWVDASQIAGLNDNDSVTTWTDLSGNGYNATQATASKKPTYKITIQNGKPVVRFDGVDDYLVSACALNNDLLTSFMVIKRNNSGGLPASFSDANTADYSSAAFAEMFRDGAGGYGAYRNTSLPDSGFGAGWKIQTQLFNGSLFRNRTNSIATADRSSSGTFNFHQILFGAYQDTASIGAYLDGDIAEFLLFSGNISFEEILLMESYLNTKWRVF